MTPKHLSRFALELMEYFCKHSELTEVAINNIYKVESEIRHLFGVEESAFNFSFAIISKLIPSLQSVLLCGLNMETMEKDGKEHIESIRKWIENPENDNLHRIVFRSEMVKGPQDAALASLVQENRKNFMEMGWALRYKYKNDEYHHILAQRMEKPIVIKLESKSTWKPKSDSVGEVVDGAQSDTYELAVDGASEFIDGLDDNKKMEFALSTVQSTLDEVLKNQAELKAIIEGFDGDKNAIRYRLVAKDEVLLKKATESIGDVALEGDHIEFESKVFPIKSNTVSNKGESLEERTKNEEAELTERKRAEAEMKRKMHEAELRAERDRLEREKMEFVLKKQEHAHNQERLLTAAAMKDKQREIEEMERRMTEQRRKMKEEKERREKEEAERLAGEQRVKMEKLRKKVTRIDALKQYLVKEKKVETDEVAILDDVASKNAYDSDTLLLSEQWMKTNSAPWNSISCAEFIADFLREKQRMLSLSQICGCSPCKSSCSISLLCKTQ